MVPKTSLGLNHLRPYALVNLFIIPYLAIGYCLMQVNRRKLLQ